jgi:hypothetical protein
MRRRVSALVSAIACLDVYEHSLVHLLTYMRAYVSTIACLDMYVHT